MTRSSLSLWRTAALAVGTLLFAASTAAAQSTQPQSPPKADVFAGVAVWNEEGSTWTGFQVSGAYRPWRHVGFVGDVVFWGADGGYQYQPDPTVMGGVRFYFPIQRVTVFGQMLVGSAPLDDVALQPGFGVDVHLNRTIAIRSGLDIKIAGDDGSTYIGSRISVGVVFAFGGK